ncbi:ATP-binding protein (plasmid) [Mesorhizobium sp. B2-1-8]|uniref:ATP-binding protein n=1 Tax=Mesorhizobium sp. B2-1-8 TaxID=2589967 RepID=UPI001AED1A4F|nr:ATP-binding protein [Mesorhizobium sp. B2-1-8]UCI22988.1 ATP-binding protein [Mesorhizobium sp. B2-1-8]
MSKSAPIQSTEGGWLRAIAERSAVEESVAKSVLQKYNIQAQTTPPRAKSLRFKSIRVAGTRAESDRDGPFDETWDNLGTGLFAVMSDRNLRGKSSILNLLYAAIRGEFRGRVKADVWKWLEIIDVTYEIDSILHRTELRKDVGEEDPVKATARLSRSGGDGNWVALYEGEGGEGLKSQTEQLMMAELTFPPIYAHNSNTGGHAHGWPLISSALFLSSSTNAKALFGDVMIDGIPLRLLQLFIGLPWVSTYSAALTAQKEVEESRSARPDRSALDKELAKRLEAVEGKLETAKTSATKVDGRAGKRIELDELDDRVLTLREVAESARLAFEAADLSMKKVSESFDDARRRVKQLEDEQSAGYSFRKLSPSCCPACEASYKDVVAAAEPAGDGSICLLCKNDIPQHTDDFEDDRIQLAKDEVDALDTSLKVARAKQKAADKSAKDAVVELRKAKERFSALQLDLAVKVPDPELEIVQLEAQAAQLRDLMGDGTEAASTEGNTDDAVKILRAATEVTKELMTDKQSEVLKQISQSVMVLAQKFGMPNVTEMQLDNGGRLKVKQGGATEWFSNLTMGERLRIKIAMALAAVEVARERGHGRHPGLMVIDSPASEEVVDKDFEAMLDSVSTAASEMGDVQIIIGTTARPSVEAVVPIEHRLHAKGDDYVF